MAKVPWRQVFGQARFVDDRVIEVFIKVADADADGFLAFRKGEVAGQSFQIDFRNAVNIARTDRFIYVNLHIFRVSADGMDGTGEDDTFDEVFVLGGFLEQIVGHLVVQIDQPIVKNSIG